MQVHSIKKTIKFITDQFWNYNENRAVSYSKIKITVTEYPGSDHRDVTCIEPMQTTIYADCRICICDCAQRQGGAEEAATQMRRRFFYKDRKKLTIQKATKSWCVCLLELITRVEVNK